VTGDAPSRAADAALRAALHPDSIPLGVGPYALPASGPDVAPLVGVAVVALASLLMLLALTRLRARFGLDAELVRKIAHVSTGLLAVALPWVFASAWPVAVITGLAVVTLLASRRVPLLRDRLGGAVNGVGRVSLGECYFPAAVGVLFAVAHRQPVLYAIPLLMLTFGDAAGAMVGVEYGRHHFRSPDGTKSAEGSLACFTASFFAVHVPLLLLTGLGRAETLLIATSLAILVTLLEAVAWGGLDNLFIPLGGYLLLTRLAGESVAVLAGVSLVACVLLVTAVVLRRTRTLTDSALVAGVLVGVACWTIGGTPWLMPPIVLFLTYPLLWPKRRQLVEKPHTLVALVAVAGVGVVWLALGRVLGDDGFFFPFTLAFAGQAAAIGVSWFRDRDDRRADRAGVALRAGRDVRRDVRAVLLASVPSWLVFAVPYWLLVPHGVDGERAAWQALAGWPITFLAGALYVLLIPADRARTTDAFPWWRQVVATLAASAVGLLLVA
jgi:phytol kinase